MRPSRPCLAARSRRETCGRETTRWRRSMLHEHNGSKHRCVVNRTDAPFGPVAGGRHSARRGGPRREAILGHPEEQRKGDARGAHALEAQPLLPGVPHGRRRRVVAAPLALPHRRGRAKPRLDCLLVIRTFGCSCHLHQISCYLGSDLHLNSVNSPYAYFSSLLMNFVHPKKPLFQSSSNN